MNAIRLLILSFLVPSELNFSLGDFVLSAYRIILIFLVPYILWTITRQLQSGAIRWQMCDTFAFMIGIWPLLAFSLNTGLGAALESGGIHTIEFLVPYFLVRLHVRNHRQRIEFAKILFLMVAILVFLGLPEFLSGRHLTHEIASALSGSSYTGVPEQRFGLWRTLGPTDHAIIFGTLCAIVLATSIMLAQRRPKVWAIVGFSGFGTVMSASSAPILAALLQLAMLVWVRITRGRRYRWWFLLGWFIAFYILIDLVSNRDPIRVMFSYFLLNPDTGYARYYMWVNSFQVATQSGWGMLFGYGYDTGIFAIIDNFYWRNLLEHTVDSFWLVSMLRFGFTILFLFAVFVILVFANALRYTFSSRPKSERHFMQAWFITAFVMSLIAATVHFWGYMLCIYMMLLAVCAGSGRRRRHRKPHSLSSQSCADTQYLSHEQKAT